MSPTFFRQLTFEYGYSGFRLKRVGGEFLNDVKLVAEFADVDIRIAASVPDCSLDQSLDLPISSRSGF